MDAGITILDSVWMRTGASSLAMVLLLVMTFPGDGALVSALRGSPVEGARKVRVRRIFLATLRTRPQARGPEVPRGRGPVPVGRATRRLPCPTAVARHPPPRCMAAWNRRYSTP